MEASGHGPPHNNHSYRFFLMNVSGLVDSTKYLNAVKCLSNDVVEHVLHTHHLPYGASSFASTRCLGVVAPHPMQYTMML